ncbi:restriction endonuclease [Pseudomonas koreensis]|uniref:restriction endonuclease n=1 Tax=Pseudomonas koreensis TaxID=198620 RepID=UPI0014728283|nr:restriction endonuclease [Pseudomonas koreensis]NNA54774.1 restriction endonuclease [Pseudomonas koreensis]
MKPAEVVKDWNGFEKFVAHLHEGAEVNVEHNKTLRGSSGATRQIDVVITHKKGPYEYLTLIECKYWNKRVKREQIDVLWASLQDLNAAKGVLFTTKGFQAGAEIYAESKGITIFVIRELSEKEWGRPGRLIDFVFQIFQKTVIGVRPIVIGVSGVQSQEPVFINISIGSDSPSECIVVSQHNRKFPTMESIVDYYSTEAMMSLKSKAFTINGGEECTRYFTKPMELNFPDPLILKQGDALYLVSNVSLEVGIKVSQLNIKIDRGQNLSYALAVVDCVNNQVYAVSKKETDPLSNWTPLGKESIENDDVLQNGSVASGVLEGYFDPKELEGLTPVMFDDKQMKLIDPETVSA